MYANQSLRQPLPLLAGMPGRAAAGSSSESSVLRMCRGRTEPSHSRSTAEPSASTTYTRVSSSPAPFLSLRPALFGVFALSLRWPRHAFLRWRIESGESASTAPAGHLIQSNALAASSCSALLVRTRSIPPAPSPCRARAVQRNLEEIECWPIT